MGEDCVLNAGEFAAPLKSESIKGAMNFCLAGIGCVTLDLCAKSVGTNKRIQNLEATEYFQDRCNLLSKASMEVFVHYQSNRE